MSANFPEKRDVELQHTAVDRSSSPEDGVEASQTGTRQDDVDMHRLGRKQQLDVCAQHDPDGRMGIVALTMGIRSVTSNPSPHLVSRV